MAVDHAGPQIEGLVDVADVAGFEVQAHGSQMHAVGILAIPFRGIALTAFLIELRGIKLGVAVAEIIGFQGFLRAQVLRIGKTVPPPVAHGAQGHAVGIHAGEGLQSCGIHSHGKASVAHSQGS